MLARSGPCRGPAREPRQIRALDLLLQVEHGDVGVATQFAPERRGLAPRRRVERMVPPAAERDRNHAPDSAIERDERCEGVLGDPVDRKLRAMLADVGDERERVDDVAQRRRPHDEHSAHLALGTRPQRHAHRNPVECAQFTDSAELRLP